MYTRGNASSQLQSAAQESEAALNQNKILGLLKIFTQLLCW